MVSEFIIYIYISISLFSLISMGKVYMSQTIPYKSVQY